MFNKAVNGVSKRTTTSLEETIISIKDESSSEIVVTRKEQNGEEAFYLELKAHGCVTLTRDEIRELVCALAPYQSPAVRR